MKKTIVVCAGLCVALAFTSCKSKESAYKKAYEKAKANETVVVEEPVVEVPVVPYVQPAPAPQPQVVDDVKVRTEDLTVIDGAPLKNYSVVVGAFGLKANAEGLCRTLRSSGYEARIVYNAARNLYRVVATTFDSKADAAYSRDQLKSKYPDAWLLFQK